jgi:hypothetical protein
MTNIKVVGPVSERVALATLILGFTLAVISLVVWVVVFYIQGFGAFTPRPSNVSTVSIERCMRLGGVVTVDGWTGNYTGCVWRKEGK